MMERKRTIPNHRLRYGLKVKKSLLFLTALLCASWMVHGQINVQGQVMDDSGEPLIGVNIQVQGANTGTSTDFDGNFALEQIDQSAILVFSYVGYQTQEVPVDGRTSINVTMQTDAFGLDEIVVTALGIPRDKKALGYSVGEVDGEELNTTPQAGVLNSMQGKVAGVQISQTYGIKGSSVSMTIRGASSLNSDNQPLFVVDGVPIFNTKNNQFNQADLGNSVGDINTDDITSISILKGPSAAALYGSRAANGVVLITTKSGAGAKQGLGVSFNTSLIADNPIVC